jgi:hypothetical protein
MFIASDSYHSGNTGTVIASDSYCSDRVTITITYNDGTFLVMLPTSVTIIAVACWLYQIYRHMQAMVRGAITCIDHNYNVHRQQVITMRIVNFVNIPNSYVFDKNVFTIVLKRVLLYFVCANDL